MFFSQRLLSFAEICLKPCAWLVYLTDICHLWLVATSCEWCSCTDIGYLCVSHQLSVDVASESNCHCHNGTNLLAFPWHIHKTECFTLHCCWVFGTSGMWDRVAGLVVPDISQDCSIFIFKVAYSNKKSPFTLWPLEAEGTKICWNVSNHKPNNTAPNPRIPECSVSQLFTCLHVLVPLSNTPVVGVRPHRYRCCALTATSQLLPLTPVHLSCCHTSCLMSGTVTFTGGCLHSAACFRPLLMPLWQLESWCLERAECKLSCHLCLYFVIVTTLSGWTGLWYFGELTVSCLLT